MPRVVYAPYWSNPSELIQLYHGDFLKVAPSLTAESVDLVFADPPFNIGYEYDQYDDCMTDDQYLEWTRQWLSAAKRLMKPTASVYVAIGARQQAGVRTIMDQVGFHWRSTIIWHYTFGPRQWKNYTPSWVAIHYATVDPKLLTWNPAEIAIPSARQIKYGDKRANNGGKMPDNAWVLFPEEYEGCFQPGQDAMLESRVCGTFKERTSHPCQMPLAVLERIIRASSREDDLVLDPFLGSGTTAEACQRLNRRCIGVELSENYLKNCVVPRLEGRKA